MAKIRLISWNVNGIRAVFNKGALDAVFMDQADIICLQETKASPDQLVEKIREKEGYTSYFASAERKGYSGVAIYSRIPTKQVNLGFGIEKFDVEGRVLAADYGDFVLFNIYFPNGGASQERLEYKMAFYADYLDHVEKLRRSGRNVVFCGDVNTAHREIDLARPKENSKISGFLPQERAWIDQLIERGYVDTFRMFNQEPEQYSWWDMKTRARERNIGWRIDYFFVNEEFKSSVESSFILPEIQGSDHCPIGLTLNIQP
jgi:exodeoxyribonuclease III